MSASNRSVLRAALAGLLLVLSSASVSAATPSGSESGVATVSRLYRDFAWEAVMESWDATGLAQQPRAVLETYFTPALAAALVADAACVDRTSEVCRLDFVPLWASQDPTAQGLSISPKPGTDEVLVRFTVPSSPEKTLLRFKVVSTAAGWRVADILYPDGNALAKLLSPPSG